MSEIYSASHLAEAEPRRHRATAAEMEERAEFLIRYANDHGAVTVRGLYYQAVVHGIVGSIRPSPDTTRCRCRVLRLRREKRLPYDCIADLTRWQRKPRSYSGAAAAVEETARFYRKSLWDEADAYV